VSKTEKLKEKHGADHVLLWERQDRQVEFLKACGQAHGVLGGKPSTPEADAILYGGAAGGGKTDALLALAIIACSYNPGLQAGFFRREYPHLEGPGGAIMRAKEMLAPLVDKKIVTWNANQRRWTWYHGAVLQFCHAKDESDVYNYQSQQFDLLLIDESTHFTEFQIRYLQTRNRATIKNWTPFTALATNPGNYSHGWHKRMFVDPGVPGKVHEVEVEPGYYAKHIFIQAFLHDNQVLEERDPAYRSKLERQPEEIKKALLEGDWSIFAGQYFKSWRYNKHVAEPVELPKSWYRFCAMDWGYAAPCALLWFAVDPAMMRVYCYREIYVTEMLPEEVADLYLDLSQDENINYVKASPDMWQERGLISKASGGESIAETFLSKGVPLEAADNRRVMGWTQIREYLKDGPDGHPHLIVFSNCTELIRTLPELIHDEKKVEDVDEKCEDHAPEALRYGLMSRPIPAPGNLLMPGHQTEEHRSSFDREEGRDDWEDEDQITDLPGFF